MNLLMLLAATLVIFYLANRWYGRGIERILRINDSEPTPAVASRDDKDFVPTKLHVVFAHHFATIAGAGPILGPTLAMLYGFLPAWLWVIFGGIFFGAVHDFTSLFVSVKEGGRSIAEVTRKTLGKGGFILFILFTLLMLYLVCGAFLNATAIALTSKWPLDKLGLPPQQHILRTTPAPDGTPLGVIGGISSTSVIIITLFSPLLGYLVYRRSIPTGLAYLAAILFAAGSILGGFRYPVTLDAHVWMIVLSIYCFIAAALPVWLILQPRDFTNVQILYGGMALLTLGVSRYRFPSLI
ncbi:MAG: carbon starvation CstA family protein [bacterium]